jgi:hypothetical protein
MLLILLALSWIASADCQLQAWLADHTPQMKIPERWGPRQVAPPPPKRPLTREGN